MTNIGCGLCGAPEGTNKMNFNVEMEKVKTVLGRCAGIQVYNHCLTEGILLLVLFPCEL